MFFLFFLSLISLNGGYMAKKDGISRTWEVLGWFGTFLIVLAYGLNTFGKLTASDPAYHVMNFVGAGLVGYITYKRRDYEPLTLQVVWCLVAIVALSGMLLS